ncbi:probable mitochondrial import receptor subunit TOM34 at N-terminal half [Coccomyxa sp. Obi]|nr:probable mitochondrial import receptor subunit TOM34 at N-terminal half [Coccomyxa sp. Obi]
MKAMESMSKMTPSQMQEMQRQMASMPPGFVERQMEAMKGMSPELLRQQMAAANSMDPAAMQHQISGAAAAARQHADYEVRASEALKEEGNRLFNAHRNSEAVEKYQRAKANLLGHTSQSAADVRRKCMLNLASCFLQLKDYKACVSECSEVLKIDPDNMKAYYRRGQALLALQSHAAAVADLRKAVERAPEREKHLVQEKLKEAEAGLLDNEEVPEGIAGTDHQDAGSNVELSTTPEPAAASHQSGADMPVDPSKLHEMLRMMQDNPGMLQDMRAAVANMTPEQIQAANRMCLPQGVEMSPEQMRFATDTIARMDPKVLESMMEASGGRAGSSNNTVSPPPLAHGSPDFKQAAAALQANPQLMSQAMEMFGKMDPQLLAAMSANVGEAGQGGQPSAAAMADMLADPQSAKAMKEMISNLTPEQLVSLSGAAGQQITPEQAEVVSKQMKNLSDKQVELLLKGASWLSKGASLAQQIKAKIMENKLLVLGILLLLIALMLRQYNLL